MDNCSTKILNLFSPNGKDSGKKHPVRHGTIIIPDMSGYTRFVQSTDAETGRIITIELLSSIINSNMLNMKVSEIEGDAVLFYKQGFPIPAHCILNQFELMLQVFNEKKEELSQRYDIEIDMSLKMVAHYGSFTEYNLSGFKKLYGKVVIESHRLLKNSIESRCYALITDDLIAADAISSKNNKIRGLSASKLCEVYGDMRNICFTYFDYENANEEEKLTA